MSGCVKKAYPTKAAAEQFAREWTARYPGAVPQYAYLCEEHGCWHLSTQDAVAHGLERSGLGNSSITPVAIPSKKPIFTPKKIDKGHRISAEEAILEKLHTTYLTDKEIAQQLSAEYDLVYSLRIAHKIPNCWNRAQNAVVDILAVDPGKSRKEIVRILGVSRETVNHVVRKLGLQGTVKNYTPRGAKSPLFGHRRRGPLSPLYGKERPAEWCAKLSDAGKGHVIPEEQRARQSTTMKKRIADGKFFSPEHRANLRAGWKKSGIRRNGHTRWHVRRNITNPNCPFCRTPSK
jgi:transposase